MNQAAGFVRTSEPTPALSPAASPEEKLRMVAHQFRQPLSSIETIAFYLSMVVPHKDEKVQEQLRQIRRLVQQCNRILSQGVSAEPDEPGRDALV